LLSISLSALLFAAPAQAAVVLDTFDLGDAALGPGWALYDPGTVDAQWLAVPFDLSGAAVVNDILTSIQGSGTYQLGIVAGAGLPSGAFLYSTTLTDPTANSLVSGLGWTLQAGDYWLVSKADPGAFGNWQGGTQIGTRPWAFTIGTNNSNWLFTSPDNAPAARITVSAIPEAGTWALMFCGLVAVGALARRHAG
jgi:hypothetical protein